MGLEAYSSLKAAIAKASQDVYGSAMPGYQEWLEENGARNLDFTFPHCKLFASRVQSLVDDLSLSEMIMSPPRHSKTTIGTIYAIIYVMLRFPGCEVMLLCHTQERATQVSSEILRIVDSMGLLDANVQGVKHWKTTNGSHLRAFGVGQRIHGFNANWIFVDDPIGTQADVESLLKRDSAFSWWTSNVLQRRQHGTKIMFIYTTGHYDDLGQRVLKMALGWNLTKVPCKCEDSENDPLGRAEGEWLCPITDDRRGLFTIKEYENFEQVNLEHSPHVWYGHYQCRPSAKEGGAIKVSNIKIIDRASSLRRMARAWDLASAVASQRDRTVGLKGGVDEDGNLVIDAAMYGRWEPGTRDSNIASVAAIDGPSVFVRLPKDPGESGIRTELMLGNALRAARVNYAFKNVVASKERRADAIAGLVNAGKVRLVRGDWNELFLDECRQFPFGAHDDFVDAAADLAAEVALAPAYRFEFSDAQSYTSEDFVWAFGGEGREIEILCAEELVRRFAGFYHSPGYGAWLLLGAMAPDGVRYIYDELYIPKSDLAVQAQECIDKFKEWRWRGQRSLAPRHVFCSENLEANSGDGISRYVKYAKSGLPMVAIDDRESEGWLQIEGLLASGSLRVHERCRMLQVYLSAAMRDLRDQDLIDRNWIGRPALDALRMACAPSMRPKRIDNIHGAPWSKTLVRREERPEPVGIQPIEVEPQEREAPGVLSLRSATTWAGTLVRRGRKV
jgi:predicted phage terminase large subunit-like protein